MLEITTATVLMKPPSSLLLYLIFNCCVNLQIASYNHHLLNVVWGDDAGSWHDNFSVVELMKRWY